MTINKSVNKNIVKISFTVLLLFAGNVYATTVEVIKTNVGIGWMEIASGSSDVAFNLTLQEYVKPAASGSYPYREYSTECPNGITLSLSTGSAAENMLFSVLLAAKQNMNYVDVRYTYDSGASTCVLDAITIKFKQN